MKNIIKLSMEKEERDLHLAGNLIVDRVSKHRLL